MIRAMIRDIIGNKDGGKEGKKKSWYELSKKEANELEEKFISHDMGKEANLAMKICIVIGIVAFMLGTMAIEIMLLSGNVSSYYFIVMFFLMLIGIVVIVSSTVEYHKKFNSWLDVNCNIIKK